MLVNQQPQIFQPLIYKDAMSVALSSIERDVDVLNVSPRYANYKSKPIDQSLHSIREKIRKYKFFNGNSLLFFVTDPSKWFQFEFLSIVWRATYSNKRLATVKAVGVQLYQ